MTQGERERETEPQTDSRVETSWMNLMVPRDELQAQINIYEESITVSTQRNGRSEVRLVAADDIAHALSGRMAFQSPVLGADAIWWGVGRDGSVLGLWRPPAIKQVAMQLEAFQPPKRFRLPMPGMVFACTPGMPPRVYAAKERPATADAQLYHSPTFNTYRDGRVCPGSHRFPEDPNLIPESFYLSFFSHTGNSDGRSVRHPEILQALWEELDGADEYPLDDLVPLCDLRAAMER